MSFNKILISQTAPSNLAAYTALEEKYGVKIDFYPFFKIEPLTSKEFRTQRINLADYTAVVFSSRATIDSYFKLCEEARFKVPETMKYFCTSELVAMYLQKHIVFRKRKIFFGDGTPDSILKLIGSKHKGEKFLITTSDASKAGNITSLFDKTGLDYTVAELVKSVNQPLQEINPASYDAIVMYNHADVTSLLESYPDFKQGETKIISYGKGVVSAIQKAGLEIAIQAPTPEIPSAAAAIEALLSNK